jgi:hypothetical protein
MKSTLRMAALVVLLVTFVLQVAVAGSRILNASVEQSGNQHNQSTAVGGPAKVTCTMAAGKDATCFVVGPGIAQQVPQGQNVGTSGAGTVTLSCNGSAPLRCQARVDGPVMGAIKKETKKATDEQKPQQ